MFTVTRLTASLRGGLRRFARDTEGYTTIEVVIILPVLFTLFAATWVYFDVFRQQAIGQKANFAIGDMISRETSEIDSTYIDNTYRLLGLLTKIDVDDPDANRNDISLRVTVIERVEENGVFFDKVKWSSTRGAWTALNDGQFDASYADNIPEMATGDQVVLIETQERWVPPLKIVGVRGAAPGLGEMDLYTFSFTRPRYTSQVVWATSNGDFTNNTYNSVSCVECTNVDGTQNNEATSSYPDRDYRH